MLRILVPALVLMVAAVFMLPHADREPPAPDVATLLPQTLALPDVELIDAAERPFHLAELDGYGLMFFGFTNCPDICPLTLQTLAVAAAELRERAPAALPEVVFISVDPYRDSPQRIAEYLSHFDAGFIGATADDATLAPLLSTLGVSVHKSEVDGEWYNVVHNATIFVLNPDGGVIAVFGGSSHDAATIVSDYLKIRRRHELQPAA